MMDLNEDTQPFASMAKQLKLAADQFERVSRASLEVAQAFHVCGQAAMHTLLMVNIDGKEAE